MFDTENLSDIEVLALTLIGEARGEPIEGQVAVASVIRNRLHTADYKNFREVCLAPKQFSCWNDDNPNQQLLKDIASRMQMGQTIDPAYRQCLYIATGVYTSAIRDNVNGAQNYLTKTLFESVNRPNWARHASRMIEKGNQIFFSA